MFILVLIVFMVPPLAASEIKGFTADYGIYYGNIHLGTASYRFGHVKENIYHFDFVSDLRFLIFSDERIVRSENFYEDQHLRPSYYSHDRKGTGPDYFEEIRFDRSENLIRSTYKDDSQEFAYEEDIIDGLSVQLQMMLDLRRGIKQPKYKILDVNRIREREFSFVSEETISVFNVTYQSVMYQLVRDNDRRKTQIWFSPEHNYLPVQMVHFAKGKKKFNARLIRFHEMGNDTISASKEAVNEK